MQNILSSTKKENIDPRIHHQNQFRQYDHLESRSNKSMLNQNEDDGNMDMSMEELDRLKNLNLERIKGIEERYLMKKNELKDVK